MAVRRSAARFAHVVALAAALAGCGSATPRDSDIYYDPALRPGVVSAEGAEAELLSRLSDIEDADVVEVGDRAYEVDRPYHAASGRWCRGVRSAAGEARLACQTDDGWTFVPQVLPTGPVTGDEPR